jgi:hypothetical protein
MHTDATVGELREAASRARAFAQSLEPLELKDSFLRLARKWEAEATALETTYSSPPRGSTH